jgi:hypothetical protein
MEVGVSAEKTMSRAVEFTNRRKEAIAHAIKAHAGAEPDVDAVSAFLDTLDKYGLALVAAYNPDRSMLHPMDSENIRAIGEMYDRAHCRHGYSETWMAVYNECIRQGKIGPDRRATDAARASALARKHNNIVGFPSR